MKTIFILLFCISFTQTNRTVRHISLLNVHGESTRIPHLGKKVCVIMYIDPDVEKLNEPISNAIQEKQYPATSLYVSGIVNCKDTWVPNRLIRNRAAAKQKENPESLILLDEDYSLPKAWNLGDCNDAMVILIIDRNLRVQYQNKITTVTQSRTAVPEILQIIEREIEKIK